MFKKLSTYCGMFAAITSGKNVLEAKSEIGIVSPEGICHTNYQSICSLGDDFPNREPVSLHTLFVAKLNTESERNNAAIRARKLEQSIFIKLANARSNIFGNIDNNKFEFLKRYIQSIIDVSVKSHSHHGGKGVGGEAAKASIADSLLNQLNSGMTETIQLITFTGNEAHTGSFILTNPTYPFVIYNAPTIANRNFGSNQELREFLQTLKPANKDQPVVVCDSFGGFHGNPELWYSELINHPAPIYQNTHWTQMTVSSYSLPFANLSNKQREFLANLMINDILESDTQSQYNQKCFKK